MKIIHGLEPLAENYDAFLVDAWGVIHDGTGCYDGALECLQKLQDIGKNVAVVSNAARRSDAVKLELAKLGVSANLYQTVVSSGDLAWQALRDNDLNLGKTGFYLGPERSSGIMDGLQLGWVDTPDEADFVLNAGAPAGNPENAGYLLPRLQRMAHRQLPMICANPDLVAIRNGRPGISAGAIAEKYRTLGDIRIISIGKPHGQIFEIALEELGHPELSRTIMVGDAFATDIAGANSFGISSLLIAGGIHHPQLLPLQQHTANRWAQAFGEMPDYICDRLCWQSSGHE